MDFRKLNSVLKQKEYTLPTIVEMFQNISGFIFASTINLNMGYLSIPLTAEMQKLLTIVTQFGFFQCCELPMGVRPATDIFQSRMVGIFMSMEAMVPRDYWTVEQILQQKTKLSKQPSKPEIEVADNKKLEDKELISNIHNTTPMNHTNLKIKLPTQLEVALEQCQVSTEDKPLKQEVYSTFLATTDNKTKVFDVGKELDGKFNSRMTTHIPMRVSKPTQRTKPAISSKQTPIKTVPFHPTITMITSSQ